MIFSGRTGLIATETSAGETASLGLTRTTRCRCEVCADAVAIVATTAKLDKNVGRTMTDSTRKRDGHEDQRREKQHCKGAKRTGVHSTERDDKALLASLRLGAFASVFRVFVLLTRKSFHFLQEIGRGEGRICQTVNE